MFSEFQIKNQEVIFDFSNTIRFGISIGTMKISVFSISVSGIGEVEKYWYRWTICIG